MARTPMFLIFNVIIDTWHQKCSEDGVTVLYNADDYLIGSQSRK